MHLEPCLVHCACAVNISSFYYPVMDVHGASGSVWFFVFHPKCYSCMSPMRGRTFSFFHI